MLSVHVKSLRLLLFVFIVVKFTAFQQWVTLSRIKSVSVLIGSNKSKFCGDLVRFS